MSDSAYIARRIYLDGLYARGVILPDEYTRALCELVCRYSVQLTPVTIH